MASTASARPDFAPHHRHDRSMVTAVVVTIWLAILIGFGMDLMRRAHVGALHFALIVHCTCWPTAPG